MIHDTAIIHPSAQIHETTIVEAYAVVGENAVIGAGSQIGHHALIGRETTLGQNNHVFNHASIGSDPQDKKYQNEPTTLTIGNNNTFREFVTINRGTVQDQGKTVIGSDNWIMAYCHIAHDCMLGNNIIMANNASLAGHIEIDDHVILGGFTLIYQFCRLGRNCFTAFGAHVNKDIPPFVMAAGMPAEARGLNQEGLKRHGFSEDTVRALKKTYRTLFKREDTLETAIEQARAESDDPHALAMIDFIGGGRHGMINAKR